MFMRDNLVFVIAMFMFLVIMALIIYHGDYKTWRRIKNEKQQSIPLQVSKEEFRRRFQEQIAGNRFEFCGEIEENNKFWFYYYPQGMQYARLVLRAPTKYDWYQIQGTVLENEVIFKYFGWYTNRTEEFERERLLNKLKELVS